MLRRGLTLALVVVLAGCGGGSKPAKPTGKTDTRRAATVPALDRAWTATPGRPFQDDTLSALPAVWGVGDLLVVPTGKAVTGIDTASGTTRWTRRFDRVCSIAPRPNAKGVVAIMTGKGIGVGGGCRAIVTIDTATGKATQRIPIAQLGGGKEGYGLDGVSIGDRVVVAFNTCDAAYGFLLRTGKPVPGYPGSNTTPGGCLNRFASDGTTVVRADRDEPEHFIGYDARTARRVFDVPVPPVSRRIQANVELARVIPSDPLVIDAGIDSERFLRRIDPGAGTQTPLGRGSDDSFPPTLTEVVDGRIVVQYGQSQALFVLDPRSGETVQQVPLASGELAVGVRDGQVITVAPASEDIAAAEVAFSVRSIDPASGAITVLGTVGGNSGFELATGINTPFFAAGVLVVPQEGRFSAYRVPAEGRPADDRPVATADLCTAISTKTKRALALAQPDLPAPATCSFAQSSPGDSLVFLDAFAYTIDAGKGRSADEAAHAAAVRAAGPDETNELPAMKPLRGLGDEAWSRVANSGSMRNFDVLVRQGDAVIRVSARYGRRDEGVPPPGARKAVQRAASEMLAELERRR